MKKPSEFFESFFKRMLEKNTKENFDTEEIRDYILMALDEYLTYLEFRKPLSHVQMILWIKYKVLEFGNRALDLSGILKNKNSVSTKVQKSLSRKAVLYSTKAEKLFR